eukprot:820194_1
MSLAALELHGSVHWKETGFEVAIFSKRTRKQYDLTVDQAYLDKTGTRFDVKGAGKMLESVLNGKVPEAVSVETGFAPLINDSGEGEPGEGKVPSAPQALSDTSNGDSDNLVIQLMLQTEFSKISFRYVLVAKTPVSKIRQLEDRIKFLELSVDSLQIENSKLITKLQASDPPKISWKAHHKLDSYFGDICHVSGASVEELKVICQCVGGVAFNDRG